MFWLKQITILDWPVTKERFETRLYHLYSNNYVDEPLSIRRGKKVIKTQLYWSDLFRERNLDVPM